MNGTKNGRTQGKRTSQSKPEPVVENEQLTMPEESLDPAPLKQSEETPKISSTPKQAAPASISKPSPNPSQDRSVPSDSQEALPRLLKAGRAPRIVLDPGHGQGGGDNGAVGPTGGSEEAVALAVAKFATEFLAGVGVEVELTRTADVATALSARVEAARKFKTDAFVSIHCNAAEAHTAEGIETLYPAPGGPSKALANVVNQALLKAAGPTHRDRGIKMSPSPGYPRRLSQSRCC